MAMYWPVCGVGLPTPWNGGMPFRRQYDFKVAALVTTGSSHSAMADFLSRYAQRKYTAEPEPTDAREIAQKSLKINDKLSKLKVYHLQAQSKPGDWGRDVIEELSGRYDFAVIVVFDVRDPASVTDAAEAAGSLRQRVTDAGGRVVSVTLLGTWRSGQRPAQMADVGLEKARETAASMGAHLLFTGCGPDNDVSSVFWQCIADSFKVFCQKVKRIKPGGLKEDNHYSRFYC